jgi:hypothetical protein
VSSDELEKALRHCFSREVARYLDSADRAGAAMVRARRARRRRAGANTVAVVLVTALAVTGLIRLNTELPGRTYSPAFVGEGPSEAPSDPPAAAYDVASEAAPLSGEVQQQKLAAGGTLPVDLVVAGHLRTTDGDSINLAMVGAVAEAYRVSGGWLVVGTKRVGRSSLWQVAKGAKPVELLSGVERLTLSLDGGRVAWRFADRLFVGTLTKGELARDRNTPAPADGQPVGFVGAGVLLASASGRRYDVWWPDMGPYEPTWRDLPSGVYGSLADGRTVVAQVPGRSSAQPCLALLDATAKLVVREQTCDVPLTAGAVGWLSPDGRWLVAEGAKDASILVDLANAFGDRPPAVDAGPGPYGPAAWIDADTVVHAGPGHELVRLDLARLADGQKGGVEWISVSIVESAVGGQPLLVVPRLAT